MDIGPSIIRKCGDCGGLIEQYTILSANTIDARIWSDGKIEAPMLPDLPQFVKCPHCFAKLWIEEQEKISEVLPYSVEQEFPAAKPYELPDLEDYFKALHDHHLQTDKEFYLRLRAWWAGNDLRRENKPEKKSEMSPPEIDNLQHLFLLLDVNKEHQRLMMAEIYRELKQFEEAEILLNIPFTEQFENTVALLKKLVRQKDPFVTEITNNQ